MSYVVFISNAAVLLVTFFALDFVNLEVWR